jgi:hypothetical protein
MSLIARLLIAILAGVFGLMMLAFASQADPDKAWMSSLFGAFCFAIALVCFLRGRAAHFVGGLIATGVVGAGLAYLAGMLMRGPVFAGRRSDTSLINAVLFLAVFGFAATKYLLATRFGFVAPPKPLSERLFVDFDDAGVRMRAPGSDDERWNGAFAWSEIVRVCFRDEGLDQSDLLLIELRGKPEPIVLPTEATGGSALFGELATRGFFPDDVWRKAIGETGRRTYCWPPHDEAAAH